MTMGRRVQISSLPISVSCIHPEQLSVNTLPQRQNGSYFCRQHFQMHFIWWKTWISIEILLKFFIKDLIDNMLALVQLMAWHQKWLGTKVIIWTNDDLVYWHKYASMGYMRQWVNALCGLVIPYDDMIWANIGPGNGLLPDGTKPLPQQRLFNSQSDPVEFPWGKFYRKYSR